LRIAIGEPSASFRSAVGFFFSSEMLAEQLDRICFMGTPRYFTKKPKYRPEYRPFYGALQVWVLGFFSKRTVNHSLPF